MKQNKLLQQIGMPFISSIFTRTPVNSSGRAIDPFSRLGNPRSGSGSQQDEQAPLNGQTPKPSNRPNWKIFAIVILASLKFNYN